MYCHCSFLPLSFFVAVHICTMLSVYKISQIIALIFVPIERIFYDNLKRNVAFSDDPKFLTGDSGKS